MVVVVGGDGGDGIVVVVVGVVVVIVVVGKVPKYFENVSRTSGKQNKVHVRVFVFSEIRSYWVRFGIVLVSGAPQGYPWTPWESLGTPWVPRGALEASRAPPTPGTILGVPGAPPGSV